MEKWVCLRRYLIDRIIFIHGLSQLRNLVARSAPEDSLFNNYRKAILSIS